MEQKPNLICKYSGCHDGENGEPKRYYACATCIERKPWKAYSCCAEHGFMYENEVAIARQEVVPYPEYIDQMITDGVITDDMLDDIIVDH